MSSSHMEKTTISEIRFNSLDLIDGGEDLQKEIGIGKVPFPTYLSFRPLIELMTKTAKEKKLFEFVTEGETILQRLNTMPEIMGPITDPELLNKNRPLVNFLINSVLPPVSQDHTLAKLSVPFQLSAFYMTPALQELKNNHNVKYEINRDPQLMYCATLVGACVLVLNRFYGQNIDIEPPFSISVTYPDSKIQRFFKLKMDTSFVEIKATKPLKPLSQEEINTLLSNIYDTDLWLKAIPAENFEFHGFTINSMLEITEEEALSRIKQQLLRKDAIVNQRNIETLEGLLQTFFKMKDLRLGLTAIDYPIENTVAHRYKIRFDFLADEIDQLLGEANQNSIYEKACRYREVLLIEDLKTLAQPTPIEEGLLDKGIRSIIVAPLFNKYDQVIGLLEIGSPRPYAMHSFIELKFKDLLSLFSMAVERSRKEIDNQVEAIIREQFTDVHPSLEWRFIEASYNLMEKREANDGMGSMEPIIFADVHPLYGQADIVNSSNIRNKAIQEDLIDNLERVKSLLKRCADTTPFPLLHQYHMQVEKAILEISEEFSSNDDSRIVDLLHYRIHPLLRHIRTDFPEVASIISGYFDGLDPDLEVVYLRRKRYEDSVDMINQAISQYLEKEQKKSQKVLPHYFTKYKTDGIEYTQYIGQSMLQSGSFCELQLQNFRLWQLIDMCRITKLVHEKQEELPVPLTTAQLVFAYTSTLSIRFRQDEKQFDVDGAYNVRYEILKKRIDKATTEETNERITQAGKIAVVYLQDKDRQEYLEYLEYLKHDGLIEPEIEDLKIGRLQGVQGLKALRVTVKV